MHEKSEDERVAQYSSSYRQLIASFPIGDSNSARTPVRAAKAFAYLTSGYTLTPEQATKDGIFPFEGKSTVRVEKIHVASLCQHHLLPFFGTCSITYSPQKQVFGLSKLKRLVDVFAHRLQLQESLTDQIADSIMSLVAPKGVIVELRCVHLCMKLRGVKDINSITVTRTERGHCKANPKL